MRVFGVWPRLSGHLACWTALQDRQGRRSCKLSPGSALPAAVPRPLCCHCRCPATGQFQSREYRDVTSNTGAPTTTVYPTK